MGARAGELSALNVLERITKDDAYFHIAMQEEIEKENLSPVDIQAATAIAKTAIENLSATDYALSQVTDLSRTQPLEKNILRIGASRILFADMPAAVAVHASVELAKVKSHVSQVGFINAVLRKLSRVEIAWPSIEKDPIIALSTYYSWPAFAIKELINLLGIEQAKQMLHYKNQEGIAIRHNGNKMSKSDFLLAFEKDQILLEEKPWTETAYLAKKLIEPAAHALYKQGVYSLQGFASQLVAKLATPNNEEALVLDFCAAPGGKSCAIAEKLKGNVVALDIHPHRVNLIRAQSKRLGLNNIIAAVHDATKPKEQFLNRADVVLVDAPCSGFGTYLNRPDVKYHRKEEELFSLIKLQQEILQNSASHVKLGGYLIYSTCTFVKRECEDIVQNFLQQNKNFAPSFIQVSVPEDLQKRIQNNLSLRLWPHLDQTDAFYIAIMERIQ